MLGLTRLMYRRHISYKENRSVVSFADETWLGPYRCQVAATAY
jgi:hypothetical protein